jgi:hypothetical protein
VVGILQNCARVHRILVGEAVLDGALGCAEGEPAALCLRTQDPRAGTLRWEVRSDGPADVTTLPLTNRFAMFVSPVILAAEAEEHNGDDVDRAHRVDGSGCCGEVWIRVRREEASHGRM